MNELFYILDTIIKNNMEEEDLNDIGYKIIKDFSNIDYEELDHVPIGFLLESIHNHYSVYMNKKLKNKDLTLKQAHIILILFNENNINQELIGSMLHINEVTTTREISSLEDKGYVIRRVDENDKRKKIVTITEEGRKKVKTITDYAKNNEKMINEFISPEELHILRVLMKKLLTSINELNLR